VAERLSVSITAPALLLRYTPDQGLAGIKHIPSPDGARDEQTGKPKLVPIVVPIFELDHADQHLFPNHSSQESFLWGSDGSLIQLPPLRGLLSRAYRKRGEISRQVEQVMENAYLNADPKPTLSTPTTDCIAVTIFKPGKRPRVRRFNNHPKAFSCKIRAHGVFELRAGDVTLIPRPDSYAVTVSVPIKDDPTEEHPTPKRPAVMKKDSLPLAYWHTNGTKAQIEILNAGAGRLASLAMNIS